MSIEQKANGSYLARWREIDGRQRARTYKTKRDARAFLATVTVQTMKGQYVAPDAGRGTFSDFAVEWASSQDWAPSTRIAFAAALKRIDKRLGEGRRLDQIDELAMAQLRQSLIENYARSTATITLHYAATVMRAAHRMRRVPRDVTQTLEPPRNRSGRPDGVTPDDVPTRAEVVAIMEAAPDSWRAAISLSASGLRVSEVLGVHAEQYDRASGVLVVDRQLQRIDGVDSFPLPKRDKVRTVMLPDWARLDLSVISTRRREVGCCSVVGSATRSGEICSTRRCGVPLSWRQASTSAPTSSTPAPLVCQLDAC
jgi:integrase